MEKLDVQWIAGVITIIVSMYGMLKFMLKDTHREVELLKEDMKIAHHRMDKLDNRLDGLYRVLLDKTYGKNIPEELKQGEKL